MPILIHITITLLIFISTVLSGNPSIICAINQSNSICAKKIIEKPKSCCSSAKEKEVKKSCFQKQESTKCDLSTAEKIKSCYKCFYTSPIKTAVLHEQKLTLNFKANIQFCNTLFNTSNNFSQVYEFSGVPNGIHKTISSTILRL